MGTIEYTETLKITTCWCGINVAIPENLYTYAKRHKNHGIYCPLGHSFVFSNTFEEQLAEERRRHAATKDLLAAEERSHRSTRGALTKQRTRAKHGVCPCCHRTFKQLAAHMKTKHPEFKPEELPSA